MSCDELIQQTGATSGNIKILFWEENNSTISIQNITTKYYMDNQHFYMILFLIVAFWFIVSVFFIYVVYPMFDRKKKIQYLKETSNTWIMPGDSAKFASITCTPAVIIEEILSYADCVIVYNLDSLVNSSLTPTCMRRLKQFLWFGWCGLCFVAAFCWISNGLKKFKVCDDAAIPYKESLWYESRWSDMLLELDTELFCNSSQYTNYSFTVLYDLYDNSSDILPKHWYMNTEKWIVREEYPTKIIDCDNGISQSWYVYITWGAAFCFVIKGILIAAIIYLKHIEWYEVHLDKDYRLQRLQEYEMIECSDNFSD